MQSIYRNNGISLYTQLIMYLLQMLSQSRDSIFDVEIS